jgi:hypothetical protein
VSDNIRVTHEGQSVGTVTREYFTLRTCYRKAVRVNALLDVYGSRWTMIFNC